MNDEIKTVLSPRLQVVLGFVGGGGSSSVKVLADIGTDHAYLPIAAVQNGFCEAAIACDLHPGPLALADRNVRDARLIGKIETRLGDGLSPILPGEANCIVIAGMGGMRIWGILSEGMAQVRQAQRLILQPQHDTELMRRNLHTAGVEIEDESVVREVVGGREHFYVVIKARYTGESVSWSEREYFLGKFLVAKGGEDFTAFVKREKEKIDAYISQIRDKSALCNAHERINWLQSCL